MPHISSEQRRGYDRLLFFVCAAVLAAIGLTGPGCSKNKMSPLSDSAGQAGGPAGDTAVEREPLIAEERLPPKYAVTDRVRIHTNMGTITVGLYGEDAPRTVANFLDYVDAGFYEDKVFHRVIPGFMVQTGGYDATLVRGETGAPIGLEIIPGLEHAPGVISMARTSDPHSATSQFFICVAEAPQLNGGYAAFGRVEEGMDIAKKISMVPTETVDTPRGAMNDVPKEPIVIKKIERISE